MIDPVNVVVLCIVLATACAVGMFVRSLVGDVRGDRSRRQSDDLERRDFDAHQAARAADQERKDKLLGMIVDGLPSIVPVLTDLLRSTAASSLRSTDAGGDCDVIGELAGYLSRAFPKDCAAAPKQMGAADLAMALLEELRQRRLDAAAAAQRKAGRHDAATSPAEVGEKDKPS